jgi:mRNA interferase RelE/StbE
MTVRVELIDEAVDDLNRYVEAGNLSQFLKKLLRLEEAGKDAGLPLGDGLTGWRKIVVGDRDWRIIFAMNDNDTVATVWASEIEMTRHATRTPRAAFERWARRSPR